MDDAAAAARDEFLEALRFVRAMFDDPLDDITFEWSEGKAKALGALAVEVLKANAILSGNTTDEAIGAYVSRFLDGLITDQMK